jgi:hypothetical protein
MSAFSFALLSYGADNMPGHDDLKQTVQYTVEKTNINNNWLIINDRVMGGFSSGNVQCQEGKMLFSGTVSTENNGGFTSAYKNTGRLAEYVQRVKVTLLGDGNYYQLRLRTQVAGNELIYKVGFPSEKNKQMTVYFNLDDFEASFRGRLIKDAPKVKANTISHVGFLILSKQTKIFSLSVSNIEFY